MTVEPKDNSQAEDPSPSSARPAWSAPQLTELSIWSNTATKGTQVVEGMTTKNNS